MVSCYADNRGIVGYNDILQSAIVVLVISFIWFYRDLLSKIHSWTHFIHSFHDELVLLVHVCLYLDNRLSLDMYCYDWYNPVLVLSLCYTNDSIVVIIHRLFFSCNSLHSLVIGWIYVFVLWGATIHFYHIELHNQEYISEMKNGTPIQQLISLVLLHPTTDQWKRPF